MANQDHTELLNALAQQEQQQKNLDRILYIVLPIIAFLISMVCANLNWQSTLATFIVLTLALIAVGIKRMAFLPCMLLVLIYCLIDNLLSYADFKAFPFKMQAGTMLSFVAIIYFARPRLNLLMQKRMP